MPRRLRRFVLSVVVAMASMLAALPVEAAPDDPASLMCTGVGTVVLPPGPPSSSGLITIVVNGKLITTWHVPGPCGTPGSG
jgi:hypothetical protein